MTAALQANDHSKSRQVAAGLIKDYASSPYADQAQLTLARLDVDDGRLDQAIAPLTQVMNDSKDAELRQIARLRLARILTDQGKPDEAIKTLAVPMPAAFAARYHEVRGDAYLTKKDIAGALAEYQAALGAADSTGINSPLVELKIQDLGAVPAPAAKAVSIDTPNKAKP
jgi:predicted negative regulator of RcsB-dependent stress response